MDRSGQFERSFLGEASTQTTIEENFSLTGRGRAPLSNEVNIVNAVSIRNQIDTRRSPQRKLGKGYLFIITVGSAFALADLVLTCPNIGQKSKSTEIAGFACKLVAYLFFSISVIERAVRILQDEVSSI